MNLLSTIYENWCHYEIIMLSVIVLSIILLPLLVNIVLKTEKRLLLVSAVSSVSAILITILVIFTAKSVFSISLTAKYSFVFIWTALMTMLSFSTLNGFFLKKKSSKDLDEDIVIREYFSDSLKLVSFICLFFSVLIAFTSNELQTILVLSGISSVLSVSASHFFARIFFKDKQSGK